MEEDKYMDLIICRVKSDSTKPLTSADAGRRRLRLVADNLPTDIALLRSKEVEDDGQSESQMFGVGSTYDFELH
jgi:hypothetical protein